MHDLIVVGAGTAGCVLAERLTRSGRHRVLLIEAGGKPASRFVTIPAGFARLFKSELDWNLQSEAQASAGGRRVFIPRGRMLGGSSNLNAQIHQWCHPADFAGWVDAGATGWSWDDVAPVFRAQERWLGDDGDGVRGSDGPMLIAPNRHAHRLSHAFVESARALGLGKQASYNGRAYDGAWIVELAHRGGRRFSVYDAYLQPASRRRNLQIITNARAARVDIVDGRAVGVTVRAGGEEQSFRANGVVLAAGAFGSPHLLMLSGIGPAAHLRRFGIAVQHDVANVGQQLQDHPVATLVFRTRGTDTFKRAESIPNLLRYLVFKRGMLASNAIEAMAFTRSGVSAATAPDTELLFAPLEWRNEGLDPPQVDAISIAAAVVAPRSRGRVSLQSADVRDAPQIDFGLLGDSGGHDASVLVAAARLARAIASTPPLSSYVEGEMSPGADVTRDEELLDTLCRTIQTVYHPTSTCRMGTGTDAVVDPRLRVRGVAGLWVADASVMPSVPRGHPNAVVAMIAHRAADLVSESLGG